MKGFDYRQAAYYFITICTKDREHLLGEIRPCVVGRDHGAQPSIAPRLCPSFYGEVVKKYIQGIQGIRHYVIMPNHIHMIIGIDEDGGGMESPAGPSSRPTASIPSRVRLFKTMVTREIGFSIFQSSFHDHIIRTQKDYEEIWRYIDGNPQCWEQDCFYRK